ncbi:MAG: hypothetical protein V1844_12820 [Pseudomonadota bacterium]
MDVRVLLIVQDDNARQGYLSALEKCAVQVFVSEFFQDLSEEICGQSYHGIFKEIHFDDIAGRILRVCQYPCGEANKRGK